MNNTCELKRKTDKGGLPFPFSVVLLAVNGFLAEMLSAARISQIKLECGVS